MNYLIITDEIKLCLALMMDDADKLQLIDALTDFINNRAVDEADMYAQTRIAFVYLTSDEACIAKMTYKKEA
jgi:hypothetical protein